MKKAISLLLALGLLLALCACGAAPDSGQTPSPAVQATDAPAPEQTPAASEKCTSLYADFLRGEARLCGDRFGITRWDGDGEAPVIATAEGYTLSELVDALHVSVYVSSFALTEINYAEIDCGGDGVPEMVVEIVMTDGYEDTLTREAVIKEIDGRLQLCYLTESYYRTFETVAAESGLIISGGSFGAASYFNRYGVVDGDGQYHDIYEEYDVYALGAFFPEDSAVAAAASSHSDEINDTALLRTVTFYGADGEAEEILYGADPEDDALTAQIFAEAGEELTESTALERRIADRLAAYGVTAEETLLDWKAVDLDAAGLGDVARYGFRPVFVSTVEELVDAVDDDVTIVLAPGTYNLTQWLSDRNYVTELYSEQTAETLRGVCYKEYDGYEFCIANISGMTIVSQDADNPAQIVSEPRYCHVISFLSGSCNTLRDLVIGHTPEQGTCCGDVLAYVDSYGNQIEGCELYGCGAYGIYASAGNDIRCSDTVIHDCSYGIVEAYNGSYLSFDDCALQSCEGYAMIDLCESTAYFNGCTFRELGPEMLWLDEDSYVTFSSCMFDAACAASVSAYTGSGTVNVY